MLTAGATARWNRVKAYPEAPILTAVIIAQTRDRLLQANANVVTPVVNRLSVRMAVLQPPSSTGAKEDGSDEVREGWHHDSHQTVVMLGLTYLLLTWLEHVFLIKDL